MESIKKKCTKVPILKITINKKYNHNFSPYSKYPSKRICIENSGRIKRPNYDTKNCCTNVVADWLKTEEIRVQNSSEQSNLQKFGVQEPNNSGNKSQCTKECKEVKNRNERRTSKRSWKCKGDLSRENVRNWTQAEKLRHLNTKAQRELEVLSMRLKALKERLKYEKREILKLNKYLSCHCKNISTESLENGTVQQIKNENFSESEDEYEKLLREVRKMKEMLEETPGEMEALREKYEETLSENNLQRNNITNSLKIHSNSPVHNAASGCEENLIEIKEEFVDYSTDNC